MLHDAMLQYYRNVLAGSSEALELVELLKSDEEGDLLKNLAFTKSGSRLVCLALARSSAKDRKLLLRAYKNTIQTLAFDPNGHQVLLTACEVIDDTVLTAKSIFSEYPNPSEKSAESTATLSDYITHITARIPLLYLFVTKPSSILPPEDLALLSEVHEIRKTTSKKDPPVRRVELVRALSPLLLAHISTQAATLIQTPFGCQFITDVILNSVGAEDIKSQALGAVANLAVPSAPENVKTALYTPAVSRMLKTLVLGGRFDQKAKRVILAEPPLDFHHLLYEQISGELVEWMTGSNAFVVVGLMESDGFTKKQAILDEIKENRSILEKAIKEGEGDKVVEAGRKGTRLLLGMADRA
jgi:pumilio family protein 6